MSRIEEALRRARAGVFESETPESEAAPAPETGPESNLPEPETFRAPWSFGSDEVQASPAVEAPAAVAPAAVSPVAVEPVALVPSARECLLDDPVRPPSRTAGTPPAEPTQREASHGREPSAVVLFQEMNRAVAERVVSTPDIKPIFAEQYRKLAGVLHHAQIERNIKVVVVTSAVPGEGKTLTSTNLALTLSESFRRSVLLIDADLRRPTLHEMFQVSNVVGLGDGLRGDEEQKLSLVQVSPTLTLLTAGRPDPDPMSGLSSDRMRRVIEEAKARFDWVILDTPPVGLLPDAKILVQMADTSLLVISAGRTPYAVVQRAVATIGRDRILGVVLNRAEDCLGGSYGYYAQYDGYGKSAKP